MVGDCVVDPVTGREFVVCWDGSGGETLLDYDTHYTRQRAGAKDAAMHCGMLTIDLRPRGTIHKGSVQGE